MRTRERERGKEKSGMKKRLRKFDKEGMNVTEQVKTKEILAIDKARRRGRSIAG